MDPLRPEVLAQNAFRVLGLTAGATQAEIDGAARQLRLWDDPALIPPTPNDVPWLGPMRRERHEVEGAVARLADPQTRVEERLWWFGATPPASNAVFSEDGGTFLQRHAALLVYLDRLLLTRGGSDGVEAWEEFLARCEVLASCQEYLGWMRAVEITGDFEKRADTEEIAAALRRLPERVTSALVPWADELMAYDDFARVGQIIRLMQKVESRGGAEIAATAASERMLNRMEDELAGRCTTGQNEISGAWRKRQCSAIQVACDRITAQFDATILPLISEITLAATMADRRQRARSLGVTLLALASEALEAAYDYLNAARVLNKAVQLAAGTPDEAHLRDRLQRMRGLSQRPAVEMSGFRFRRLTLPMPSDAIKANKKGNERVLTKTAFAEDKKSRLARIAVRWWGIFLFLVFVAFVLCMLFLSLSSLGR